jgi:hypothetical protein
MRLFYDLWESKMRKLHLPETIGMTCCASYRGWLLLVATGASELFLLNPLTRARVNLPPFTTPVTHICAEAGDSPIKVDYLFRDLLGSVAITKVTFSSDLTDPNCIIMVFFQRVQAIFFCRVGDHRWTEVIKPFMPISELADAVYHNGRFHLLNSEMISTYDPSQKVQGVYFFKPELRGISKFFLVGKSGLYLLAARFMKQEGAVENNNIVRASRQMVEMYHIPDDTMVVNRITDTSDTTIFFGDNYHYLSVCADDWDSLDGGCMYMEYSCVPNAGNDGGCMCLEYSFLPAREGSYSIVRGKLGDDKTQPLVTGFGKNPEFFPLSPAMWFQPSFV